MSNYLLSSSPHMRSPRSTQSIMRDVIIALIPAGIVGVYAFGWYSLALIAVCVAFSVGTEALIQKIQNKNIEIKDLSAVVTGLLLAYNLPATAPLWMAAVGSIIAIALVKMAFGGLGHNFMNPALAARVILVISWPIEMTNYPQPTFFGLVDVVSSATPLTIIKEGYPEALPSLLDVFIGNVGGVIGEISAAALLLGAIYLLIRKVITWHIPLTYIATVFVLSFIFGGDKLFTGDAVYLICSGGLMLGAFYMATDYSSSPITRTGQIIFGIGCGILTAVIRIFGGYAEGVSYSIIIMNLIAPLIDKYIKPRIYGEAANAK